MSWKRSVCVMVNRDCIMVNNASTNSYFGRKSLLAGAVIAAIIANIALLLLRQYAWNEGYIAESIPIEPLKFRQRLVDAIRSESIADSVQKLADFDDTVWLMGNTEPDTALNQSSYRYLRVYIPNLVRVRRILQEAPASNQEEWKVPLLECYAEAHKNFPAIKEAKSRQIASSVNGVVLSSPDEFWRATICAPTSAYLLSELDVFEALPLFVATINSEKEVPVDRSFIYFAAHRLVARFPSSELSSRSVELRNEYLNAAKDVPRATLAEVFCWDSPYEETDFRFGVLRREPPVKLNERLQVVSIYPDLDVGMLHAKEQVRIPSIVQKELMEEFADSVYGTVEGAIKIRDVDPSPSRRPSNSSLQVTL